MKKLNTEVVQDGCRCRLKKEDGVQGVDLL